MSNNLAIKDDGHVGRPLKVLVQLIKEEIAHGQEAAEQAAKPFYQRAGEYLLEAKLQIPRGQWETWIRKNLNVSERAAQEWMQYAKALPEYRKRADSALLNNSPGLREVIRPDYDDSAMPSRSWQAPVREVLTNRITPGFVERMAQERENTEKELKLIRDLTVQMIDLGLRSTGQRR